MAVHARLVNNSAVAASLGRLELEEPSSQAPLGHFLAYSCLMRWSEPKENPPGFRQCGIGSVQLNVKLDIHDGGMSMNEAFDDASSADESEDIAMYRAFLRLIGSSGKATNLYSSGMRNRWWHRRITISGCAVVMIGVTTSHPDIEWTSGGLVDWRIIAASRALLFEDADTPPHVVVAERDGVWWRLQLAWRMGAGGLGLAASRAGYAYRNITTCPGG